jgi:hypothetical protein
MRNWEYLVEKISTVDEPGKLQIRDSRDRVMKSKRGFSTQEEAVAVGDNEKDRLVASGSLPGDGVPTPSRSTRRSRR